MDTSLLFGKPFITALIGHFNAKSKDKCPNDKTSSQISGLDFVSSTFGLLVLRKEPTYILENSCMDKIFTPQLSMIYIYNRIIIYAKFDMNIFYPPLCKRTALYFKHVNFGLNNSYLLSILQLWILSQNVFLMKP